ncbi:hypothetical protein E2R59_00375 [Kocuria rosea]|uniref:Protein CR006 P-loop domain-containing protein n=1 Tax=Kocuria rosea TaxID=1275 RepID=A0A4R5YMH9_KOCRO|nr:hypothetical protein E2R59_00375 [Kocuria rosea]
MAGSVWRSHVRGHGIVEEDFVIREIKLAGTHCFDPDSVLGDLTKVNYVFGPNGSGKTTISAGLADFSTDPAAARALDVQWEASHQTIKVYNRNYMRKAFTSVDGEEPGVFLLGEEDGAAYQQIQDISAQKAKADQRADSAQAQLDQRLKEAEKLRSDLADNVWNKRSVIPQGLQQHMPGLRGRKEACLEKVLAAAEAHSERGVDDLEALAKKAEVAFYGSVQVRNPYPEAPALSWDETALEESLDTPIVGSADLPLMDLMRRLGHSDWVHQGLVHFKSEANTDGLCPFCQQSPPASLAEQLAEVFDDSYKEKTAEIEEFRQAITQAIVSLDAYKETYARNLSTDVDDEDIDGAFHVLSLGLQAAKTSVEQKILKPSDKIAFTSVKVDYDTLQTVVRKANLAIEETNKIVRNRHGQREIIVEEAWREFAHGHLNDLLTTFSTQRGRAVHGVKGLRASIEKHRGYSATHDVELKKLQSKTVSSAKTIDDINKLLELSQFHSFKLAKAQAQEDGYRLIRDDNQPADVDSLSEGERTFITFLYFFHWLSGVKQDNESDKVVAVIDDPISSLDGDIMFVISALTRMLIDETKAGIHKRVDQVILLTHNTRFHNEVSYQHKGALAPAVKYYRIRKHAPKPNVVEYCGQKNPIRTAYQELWDEVQTACTHPTDQMPWLPNVMRRILESYFATLGGMTNLYELGEDLAPADRALHNALIAWSHSGSHTIMDDEAFAQHSAPSNRWLEAFQRIFTTTADGAHRGHYDMMMDRAQAYVIKPIAVAPNGTGTAPTYL